MSTPPTLAYITPGTVYANQLIPKSVGGGTWPHRVDIYVPRRAPIRALVSLHGGGGTKAAHANSLRVLLRRTQNPTPLDVRWEMLEFWRCIAVFPQGQACLAENAVDNPFNPNGVDTRSDKYPNGVATWGPAHMYSGADDMSFLVDLHTYLLDTFATLGSNSIHLAGHSNGGMMTQRMWREMPVYRCHACISGPAPRMFIDQPYEPSTLRPLWMQFGSMDEILGIRDGWYGEGLHWPGPWFQQPPQLSKANVYGTNIDGVWTPLLAEYENGVDTFNKAIQGWVLGPTPVDPPYSWASTTPVVTTDEMTYEMYSWQAVNKKITLRLINGATASHELRKQQQTIGKALWSQILRWIVFETT